MADQPLAEVFGFPIDQRSTIAERYRKSKLCPHNNRVPNCTKDKANDPLGVCSIFDRDNEIAITCPVRFRQDWLIAEDAASFFFPPAASWTSLSEVRINDHTGQSAGNIDLVLVSYDERGYITDFGTLEVQAVYISGNVRRWFEEYAQNPPEYLARAGANQWNYPRPDYLSSSRKRLVPQLIYKGGILKSWGKKQAVALHRGFFETLPPLTEVEQGQAELVWLVYDLVRRENQYQLVLHQKVYTAFKPALDQITTPEPGPVDTFLGTLQEKLDQKLENDLDPPDAPTLSDLL